jgi:RimJ/RimL family protein N-acetyltransferase
MPALIVPTVVVGSLASKDQPVLRAGAGDVLLRPWLLTDAPVVMAAYQDPAIQRWHMRRADSLAEATEWVEGWRAGWLAESSAQWAVVDAASDAVLGRVALKCMNLSDGVAEVAYWTASAARGKGVCTHAVDAMTSWAFSTAGFHRLELQHSTRNEASCRVAEKTGFELEGVRRQAWLQADGRHDVHCHARLAPR